jgi:hypothetical protein
MDLTSADEDIALQLSAACQCVDTMRLYGTLQPGPELGPEEVLSCCNHFQSEHNQHPRLTFEAL